MSKTRNNWKRTAAFAVAVSVLFAANPTPTAVLAAEITDAVLKKASVAPSASHTFLTQQDNNDEPVMTTTTDEPLVTTSQTVTSLTSETTTVVPSSTTISDSSDVSTTTLSQTTTPITTTTTTTTSTTPAPQEQTIKTEYSFSFGNLEKIGSVNDTKNHIADAVREEIQNALNAKQLEGVFYGIELKCEKKDNVPEKIVITYKTYDTDAAKEILEEAFPTALSLTSDHKYYCQFAISTTKQIISCEKVFCRFETEKGCKYSMNYTWKDGEAVLLYNDTELYVQYGIKLAENLFTADTGYYLEPIKRLNGKSEDGVAVSDTVKLSKDSISVGGHTIYQLKDCIITLSVQTDSSINTTYVPQSFKWSELNNNQIELKFQSALNESKGAVIQAENHNQKICQFYDKTEQVMKLKELLPELKYDLLTLGTQKQTNIKLSITALPNVFELNVKFENSEETEKVKVLQSNNQIQIPYLMKRDGIDYYLASYTVNRNGGIKDDTVDLTWNDVFTKLSSGQSYETKDYLVWEKGAAENADVLYRKVGSTQNITVVRQLKSEFFAASQVNRNVHVMTWDFKKAFSVESDLNNITVLMVGSDQNTYQASFFEIPNEEADAPKRYRLTMSYGADEVANLKYLRVQTILDNTLSESPCAIEGFEPFYIYVDHQAPIITNVENSYPNGWSNTDSFTFSLQVSDDEGEMSQSDEDQEALRNINLNTDLESIKELHIGDYVLKKPEGGWVNGSMSSLSNLIQAEDSLSDDLSLSSETVPYDIKLTPVLNDDDSFSGKFDVVLFLKDSTMTYFSKTLSISAVDYCGLQSETLNVNVQIDTAAPTVTAVTIDGLTDGMNGERVLKTDAGKELVVHADITDGTEASGIFSVRMQYADRKPQEVNNINAKDWNHQMTFSGDNSNRCGVVAITIEDYAGNSSTYYYARKADKDIPVDSLEEAISVMTDFISPSVPQFSELREADFFDRMWNRRWYQNYLNMPISAADEGLIRSELSKIEFKINDSEWYTVNLLELIEAGVLSDEALAEKLAAGKFYMTFEQDADDSQNFSPYICCAGNSDIKIPLTEELFRLRDSGVLTVEMRSYDRAGNRSESASQTIYIDNTKPSADTHFSAETHHIENPIASTLFGVFSSAPIHIRVRISDTDDNTPSSGIQEALLTFAGTEYRGNITFDEQKQQTIADFRIPDTLPKESCVSDVVTIQVTDMVGHTYVSESLLSDKEQTLIMLENKAPVLPKPIVEGPDLFINEKGEKWYSGDVTVTYSVSDSDSGIAEVDYKRIQKNSNSNDRIFQDYSTLEEKTISHDYSLITDTAEDGQADFQMRVKDNAGNLSQDTETVYKDVSKPYVSAFNFTDARSFESSHPDYIVEQLAERFGHFSQQDTVLQVTVRDDHGASAGIQYVSCALYRSDGTLYQEVMTQSDAQLETSADGSRIAYFVLPEGFKGDVAAWTADNVRNNSEQFFTDGFASENESRHEMNVHLNIALPQTDKRDVNGLLLYNTDVIAKLTVEDSFSGIRRIEWSTSDTEGWQSVEIDRNGEVIGGTWTVEQKERNLAMSATAELMITKDANADFIRLRIEDNSGNISEDAVSFSIDKQKPQITVGGLAASQQTTYYNHDITANVAIAERNFASPTVNGAVDNGFTADPNSPENTDHYLHTKQYVYNADGVYSLTVDCTDLAGNVTNTPFNSGEFIIDKTIPKAELTFRTKSGGVIDPKKQPYISEAVSAVFTVTEQNFDPARAVVMINGQNYAVEANAWKNEQNNVHILTIPADKFNENQHYTVAASVTDMAGNASATNTAEFVIDKINPTVEISGFSAANKDSVAPLIKASDANFADCTLKLTRNGKECAFKADDNTNGFTFAVSEGNQTISGQWESLDSGKTRSFRFDDFPHEEAFDGAYQLTVTAEDLAGRTTTQTAEFTINRFGSVFIVTDYEKINKQHLSAAQNIEIFERNVDRHAKGSEIIVVIDKGSSTVQLTNDDFNVSEPVQLSDQSGYEYKYTINADNFSQDLDYKITISTTDEAGNANVSTNRGAELDFTVDTHMPEFVCDDLFDRAEFRTSQKEFRINVNEPLREICVKTTNNEILLEKKDEGLLGLSDTSFTFAMNASNTSRGIIIELTDLAGNITKQEYTNLLVTENVVLYAVHKAWVKIVGASVLAAGIGIGAFFGIRKTKRKKNEF